MRVKLFALIFVNWLLACQEYSETREREKILCSEYDLNKIRNDHKIDLINKIDNSEVKFLRFRLQNDSYN